MRACLILAALAGALPASGVAQVAVMPNYTAAGIVNGANFVPGPVARNGLVTIFGTNLSYYTAIIGPDNTRGGLPTELGYVRVLVNSQPAPLIYVSDKQINFLMPASMRPPSATIQVYRQGVLGPEVPIPLSETAPALFQNPGGFLLASHADYSPVTPDAPAAPGEIVILWGTGFGVSNPGLYSDNAIPALAYPVAHLGDLQVFAGGLAVDPARILYCGVTPGFAGLYQLNVRLPEDLPADPEIRVAFGSDTSATGQKLASRASP